jgi:hypothetical protein
MIAAVSCCLSATGIRFSGHPVPAQDLRVPHGRPTRQRRAWTQTGFPRSTPARYDRVGCPLYPGDSGAHPGRMPCPTSACRFTTASPYTALTQPTCTAPTYETSTRVHAIHPSGLPLTCNPRMERGPSGFPSSFAPRRYQRRTSKVGPRREHAPGTRAPTSAGPPIHSSLTQCDLVSQRQSRTLSLPRPTSGYARPTSGMCAHGALLAEFGQELRQFGLVEHRAVADELLDFD